MKYLLLAVVFFIRCSLSAQVLFTNPILAGFYPDPSICKAGNDYYLVNSSFAYYPGLPIFHSTDLVNWNQLGAAMNRPSQLPLWGAGVSRGLFAPTIRYHNGMFYIVCTLIDHGGNFIITTKDPGGSWSEPVFLPYVDGIDPSLFFDETKLFLVYNSVAPANKPLYNGHRTIRMIEIDTARFQPLSPERILINGGTDLAKEPVWIEGPHLFKKDGWYYLFCAEGGTAYQHSEVVFRARTLTDSFTAAPHNPILTQRQLSPARPFPVTTTGHADFVITPDNNWWCVFLGCRPYDHDYYNTGRETWMLPVQWENDWPVILKDTASVPYHHPVPATYTSATINNPYSGNIQYHDDFSGRSLNPRWTFLRTIYTPWYKTGKAGLQLSLQHYTIAGKSNPSMLAFRQSNAFCTATTLLRFSPTDTMEKAGLVIFQNESHFYWLCRSLQNGIPAIQLYKGNGENAGDSTMQLVCNKIIPRLKDSVVLQIEAAGDQYIFRYALPGDAWTTISTLDGKWLSTAVAGGFVGAVFGLYGHDLQGSGNTANYCWFNYSSQDRVYNDFKNYLLR